MEADPNVANPVVERDVLDRLIELFDRFDSELDKQQQQPTDAAVRS